MLLTPPAVEPLTLAEAKAYLRVETGDDDELIASLIGAARAHIESATRRAFITQTWRLVRDAWPADGRIAVVPMPLIRLIEARVFDGDGAARVVDPQHFSVDTAQALLAFARGALPAPGRLIGGIEIDVEVGYGASADAVPAPLRQGVRLLVAHWYEHRAIAAVGQAVTPLPTSIAALIAPYRVVML